MGEFTLSLEAEVLMRGEEVVPLGQRAVAVLRELAKRPGEVVSKTQLLRDAWQDKAGRQAFVEPGSLQVQIYNLRQALGKDAIKTVMDRGYRLALPVSLPSAGNSRFPVPMVAEPLIGRETDEAALVALLRKQRLVTLLGGPGVGKTSLAAQLAGHLPRDSVQWLELAALRDEGSLIRMVAAACRVGPGEDSSIEALVAALKDQAAFLILDNAEHLSDAVAPLCAALHAHCPKLTCLVTSQVPLRVAGEQVYPLAPLGLPEEGAAEDEARAAPAVALFIRVAESRGMQSTWTRELGTIIRLVRALSGNALAIHHVAANAQVMDLDRAGNQMDTLFHLSRADPNEPLRHRTLSDAFDWSHALLGTQARQLFHALARFPAGLDLAHVGLVAEELGMSEASCRAALRDLVDRSFVFPRPYTQRVALPEAARHYSQLWLQGQGDSGGLNADGLDRVLVAVTHRVAQAGLRDFLRVAYPDWLDRLSPEWDNLYAAVQAARRLDMPSEIIMLSCMAWTLWVQGDRGYWVLHLRDQLSPALLARASAEVQLKFRLLSALTMSLPGSRELLALPETRALLSRDGSADLIALLAASAYWHMNSDPDYAKACLDEALTLLRSEPVVPPVQAMLLQASVQQAIAAGDVRRALREAERALALAEQCGPGTRGLTLIVALQAALLADDPARLQALWQRCHEWGKGVAGRMRFILLARFAHGFALAGDRPRLLSALKEIVEQTPDLTDINLHVMDYLASLALHLNDPSLAAGMLVAAGHAHEECGQVRDRVADAIHERLVRVLAPEDIESARGGIPVTLGEVMAACTRWIEALEAQP